MVPFLQWFLRCMVLSQCIAVLQLENGHSEHSKLGLMHVFCLLGLCDFLYLLSRVLPFALVTAFCAHDKRSDGSLFTLRD